MILNMKQYGFPYRREYSTLVGEIYRPVATAYLQTKDKRWIGFTLYADSGADITLLPRSACEGLGYDLEDGKQGYVGGITRGRIKVYIHEINMKLGQEIFEARVAFAQTESVPPLLGRTDVFDRFKVCYDNEHKETVFIMRWLLLGLCASDEKFQIKQIYKTPPQKIEGSINLTIETHNKINIHAS